MFSNIPPTSEELRKVFTGSANTAPQIWNKPAGINFVSITCIGGGGGGGTGQSGSSGTARTGGAGGGSGGVTNTIFPAYFIPEILYVAPGLGGEQNTSGGESFVSSWSANTTSGALKLCAAPGGQGASGITVGGAVAAYNFATNCLLAAYAFRNFYGGVAGALGGVGNATGGSVEALSNHILTGGAGGGGCTSSSYSGGSVLARGPAPVVPGGNFAGSGTPTAFPWAGYNGSWFWKPMMFGTGGAGGQGQNVNTGGYGGVGGYGCGGGGGGGGTSSGVGGRGGDGLVIIDCW